MLPTCVHYDMINKFIIIAKLSPYIGTFCRVTFYISGSQAQSLYPFGGQMTLSQVIRPSFISDFYIKIHNSVKLLL